VLLIITEVNEIKKFNIAKKINGNAFNASVICSRLNSLHLHSSVKIKRVALVREDRTNISSQSHVM